MKKYLPSILVLLLTTTLFEILSTKGFLNPALVPAPSQVFKIIYEMRSDFYQALFETLWHMMAGWILSIALGLILAFLFSLSKLSRQAILPFAVFFQTVPIIAIAPLLVIYFGFGAPTVIASSCIVSIFPIIANTLMGLENANSGLKDLFHVYHATSWQTLLKLKLPSSYSYIYSGLKISAGLAIIGAVAGEFVGGGGLGALIDAARTQQRVDIVFASILLLSLLGLLLVTMLTLLHKIILLQRPFTNSTQE